MPLTNALAGKAYKHKRKIIHVYFVIFLTKKNDMESVVDAEIRARRIAVTKSKANEAIDAKLKYLKIAEKRKLLRVDERKSRIDEDLKEADITYIQPKSDEMKAILTGGIQQRIIDIENGITDL